MANRFWVGDSGTWDGTTTTNWATSSGGAGGASAPGFSDDVFFDANSFSANGAAISFTAGSSATAKSLDCSGVTKTFTFSMSSGAREMDVLGNFKLSPKVTISGTASVVLGSTGGTLDQAGASISCGDFVVQASAGYTLASALNITARLVMQSISTFTANGFNVTATTILVQSTIINPGAVVVNMGTGTWTCSGLEIHNASGTITINASTSLLLVHGTFNTHGDDYTFHDIQIPASSSLNAGSAGNITCHNLTGGSGTSLTLPSAKTFTVQNALSFNGISSSHASISSGSTATLSAASVSVSFVDVLNNTAANATPFVDTGGIDSGGNTNWQFPAAPNATSGGAFLLNFV